MIIDHKREFYYVVYTPRNSEEIVPYMHPAVGKLRPFTAKKITPRQAEFVKGVMNRAGLTLFKTFEQQKFWGSKNKHTKEEVQKKKDQVVIGDVVKIKKVEDKKSDGSKLRTGTKQST